MEQSGHFECSEPLLNQLQSNILWGQKGNFVDIPTDCHSVMSV
jgi:alpha-L-rhamnosidase